MVCVRNELLKNGCEDFNDFKFVVLVFVCALVLTKNNFAKYIEKDGYFYMNKNPKKNFCK